MLMKTTTDKNQDKINWTKAWSKKYPVLERYQQEVDIPKYSKEIRNLLETLKKDNQYSELDAMLVLKDILYQEWKKSQK